MTTSSSGNCLQQPRRKLLSTWDAAAALHRSLEQRLQTLQLDVLTTASAGLEHAAVGLKCAAHCRLQQLQHNIDGLGTAAQGIVVCMANAQGSGFGRHNLRPRTRRPLFACIAVANRVGPLEAAASRSNEGDARPGSSLSTQPSDSPGMPVHTRLNPPVFPLPRRQSDSDYLDDPVIRQERWAAKREELEEHEREGQVPERKGYYEPTIRKEPMIEKYVPPGTRAPWERAPTRHPDLEEEYTSDDDDEFDARQLRAAAKRVDFMQLELLPRTAPPVPPDSGKRSLLGKGVVMSERPGLPFGLGKLYPRGDFSFAVYGNSAMARHLLWKYEGQDPKAVLTSSKFYEDIMRNSDQMDLSLLVFPLRPLRFSEIADGVKGYLRSFVKSRALASGHAVSDDWEGAADAAFEQLKGAGLASVKELRDKVVLEEIPGFQPVRQARAWAQATVSRLKAFGREEVVEQADDLDELDAESTIVIGQDEESRVVPRREEVVRRQEEEAGRLHQEWDERMATEWYLQHPPAAKSSAATKPSTSAADAAKAPASKTSSAESASNVPTPPPASTLLSMGRGPSGLSISEVLAGSSSYKTETSLFLQQASLAEFRQALRSFRRNSRTWARSAQDAGVDVQGTRHWDGRSPFDARMHAPRGVGVMRAAAGDEDTEDEEVNPVAEYAEWFFNSGGDRTTDVDQRFASVDLLSPSGRAEVARVARAAEPSGLRPTEEFGRSVWDKFLQPDTQLMMNVRQGCLQLQLSALGDRSPDEIEKDPTTHSFLPPPGDYNSVCNSLAIRGVWEAILGERPIDPHARLAVGSQLLTVANDLPLDFDPRNPHPLQHPLDERNEPAPIPQVADLGIPLTRLTFAMALGPQPGINIGKIRAGKAKVAAYLRQQKLVRELLEGADSAALDTALTFLNPGPRERDQLLGAAAHLAEEVTQSSPSVVEATERAVGTVLDVAAEEVQQLRMGKQVQTGGQMMEYAGAWLAALHMAAVGLDDSSHERRCAARAIATRAAATAAAVLLGPASSMMPPQALVDAAEDLVNRIGDSAEASGSQLESRLREGVAQWASQNGELVSALRTGPLARQLQGLSEEARGVLAEYAAEVTSSPLWPSLKERLRWGPAAESALQDLQLPLGLLAGLLVELPREVAKPGELRPYQAVGRLGWKPLPDTMDADTLPSFEKAY